MSKTELEQILAMEIEAAGLPRPETEHVFCSGRRWRFDFAWPERWLAVEVEGGTWVGGRHVRPQGFEADCEKYNTATLLGWRVLRFTGDMVRNGQAVPLIRQMLGWQEV